MMGFFGRSSFIPEFSETPSLQQKMERWIRVENGLPDSDRLVQTVIKKKSFDKIEKSFLELQNFCPRNGWLGSSGVIAWKECDSELLSMIKEKQ